MEDETPTPKREPKIIVFKCDGESIVDSLIKDIFTMSFLLLCIYVSQGSAWWTFFTGSMFIICGCSVLNKMFNDRKNEFHSKAELIAWAEKLEGDGK